MIKVVKVSSKILREKRTIRIFTPDSVKGPFSVLYMHDGQNLFSGETSFGGEHWDVATQVDRLIKSGVIPPLMVVGVDNTKYRLDEFVPFDNSAIYKEMDDKYRRQPFGDLYAHFITRELKPWVDKRYPTKKDFQNTFIAGSSLGALISLYIGLKYKDTFRVIGAFSPSTYWNQTGIEAMLNILLPSKEQGVFMTLGTHESANLKTNKDIQKSTKYIHNHLKKLINHYHFEIIQGGRHNEPFWAMQVPTFLRFIFEREQKEKGD